MMLKSSWACALTEDRPFTDGSIYNDFSENVSKTITRVRGRQLGRRSLGLAAGGSPAILEQARFHITTYMKHFYSARFASYIKSGQWSVETHSMHSMKRCVHMKTGPSWR